MLVATIPSPVQANNSDLAEADGTVRLRVDKKSAPNVLHARVDLNGICTGLLANWWCVLCRREDPYKLFPVQRKITSDVASDSFTRATGRIELFAHSTPNEQQLWSAARQSLEIDEFRDIVLNELVRPLVHHLRATGRLDRPIESMLHRTEEILQEPESSCSGKPPVRSGRVPQYNGVGAKELPAYSMPLQMKERAWTLRRRPIMIKHCSR